MESPSLPPLHLLRLCASVATKRKREAEQQQEQQQDRAHTASGPSGQSSIDFFTLEDFRQWKRKVLELLSQPTSEIHDIVRSGHLPILSKKSKNWFGVTASCRYHGQNVCHSKDLDDDDPELCSLSRRLRGLLESDKPMQPSEKHRLQDHTSATFLLMYLRKLVVDDSDKTEPYLYLDNLYPRTSKLDWLTGGDLLCATGIIFALTRVRYLMVGEGPSLRSFEVDHGRKNDPGYFYYNKFILAPAQHVQKVIDCKRSTKMRLKARMEPDDSTDECEYQSPEFVERVATRDPDTIMKFWLWENPLWQPA